MSLTSKQRSKLKAIASTIDATCIVGVNGITENVVSQIKMDFLTRELVKVKVLPNTGNNPKDCMQKVAEEIHAEPVYTIGNYFVLYKVNNKKGFKHLLAVGED